MTLLSQIIVGLVAFIHFYILWLEIFVWTTRGKKVFKTIPEDMFEKTKVMAANQGLYNGFLAAGLIWGISLGGDGQSIKLFFLSCVIVAGIFGALTANKKIFFIQAMPGAIALIVTWMVV